jgi:signal transduction histidine kinase
LTVVVAVTVVALSVVASVQFLEARQDALGASTNGLPSVAHMARARTALREIDAAADLAILDRLSGRPFDPAGLERTRQALGTAMDDYLTSPFYEGEADVYRVALDRLRSFDESLETLHRRLETGTLEEAVRYENREWRAASNRFDDALQALGTFNAQRVSEYAEQAIVRSARSILVLTAIATISLVLMAVAMRATSRAVRQRERALAARADEWEVFSGRVAHDLVSPLQTVGIAMSVASERCRGDETVSKLTVRASEALRRIRTTVDTLLAFARSGGAPARGETAPARGVVAAAIEEALPYADEQAVELHADPVPDVEVGCSPGTLDILLSNLLRNAVKYMGDRPVRRVELKVSVNSDSACFEVHDTGPGVEPGMESRVFQPFVRGRITQVGGIGLGLATVKRMAEAHGGAVGVRPASGGGSVFWVRLPTAPRPARAEETHGAPPPL